MKVGKYFVFIIIAQLFFVSTSDAQLKILLGPTIGLTTPTVDYSCETTDYYAGTKYGLRSGINFGAMGKLSLGPINFRLSVIYSPLSNDGSADPTNSGSTAEIKHNLFTVAIGPEYGFNVPASPIKPYLGFDLLFSTISGHTKFQGTANVTSSPIDLSTATRTGLGFAAGVEVKLLGTAIDVSVRYNLINLFNKQYEGPANGIREDAYKYLNDQEDPNYLSSDPKHPVGNNRTIATIQFQLGVLFGF